ncbi:MAG: cobalamin-independent methionine synthase II family protein [Beijerinckiaceae bacterium]
MRRSSERILTTHAGSLPSLPLPAGADAGSEEDQLRASVGAVVAQQRALGLDIVNEGEYAKGGDWVSFIDSRFGGFEGQDWPADQPPIQALGKDRKAFDAYYKYAAEKGILFYTPDEKIQYTRRKLWHCTGPISYTGAGALAQEIAVLKETAGTDDVFLTSTAPASLEPYRRNAYYKSHEEFLFAMAEALAVEYGAIADAGFILQVDDAWLPALWDRIGIDMGLDAYRKYCMLRVEALNHALKGIPEDRVRYHLCWGSWHGPHAFDIEMKDIAGVLLAVNAQAYLIEAGNVRHEHEWQVWQDVKLPDGKILIPGVVSHATATIEHPELVAQRLIRFAGVVGRENVIAGTDCGFGGRSHPQIAWAKLKALCEGARLASERLWT